MALIKTLRRGGAPSRELPDLPDAAVNGDRHRLHASAAAGNTATLSFEQEVERLVVPVAPADTSTDLTAATNKAIFRAPFKCRLVDVRASVSTAPAGSTIVVDVNNAGTSMLSTKLSIDAGEKTSTTAAAAAVIDTAHDDIADDAELSVDIDQIGSGTAGKGLKVVLYVVRVD